MFSSSSAVVPFVIVLAQLLSPSHAADQPNYQSCPLLRAYYPLPTIEKSSDSIKDFSEAFTSAFDNLVLTGESEDYGSVTPNITSFSVVLFSEADDGTGDPIFYDYQYTAPAAKPEANVSLDTVFPLGTLTQLFTVYTWLVQFGDSNWEDPVTKFLPELQASVASSREFAVDWNDITIGSLAGQMAGIARDCAFTSEKETKLGNTLIGSAHTCELGKPCDRQNFLKAFASIPPLFLPDTTPILSNAAFQLIALALTARDSNKTDFSSIVHDVVFHPLSMNHSCFLNTKDCSQPFGEGLNTSAPGEQAALSMLSTTRDLARAGQAMLSSRLVSAATTRRWFQPVADTSNLRNGVGRPWEIYHAGIADGAAAPILDVFLKAGEVAQYSSYIGLSPDIGAGFAILAHNTGGDGVAPDLNVYADIVSDGIGKLLQFAAAEAVEKYVGVYGSSKSGEDGAVINISDAGPGFVVEKLVVGGVDIRAKTAAAARIGLENLDFRVYPTNVFRGALHQFVPVFQDMSTPVDQGTPTCITWISTDSLGTALANRFVFELDDGGMAKRVLISGSEVSLDRSE